MPRDNILRIIAFAEIASMKGVGNGEKGVPKLFLQLLDLPLKICYDGCLFLISRRSDEFARVKTEIA